MTGLLKQNHNKLSDQHYLCILVVLGALLCLVPLLGLSPVFQVSEAREGVVVHEMLRSQHYVLPLRHGDMIPSKPMLFHWIGAMCSLSLDRYDEFCLRLPSALAAIGCVLIVFGFSSKLFGASLGALGSAVLLSTYGFYRLATDGRVDMVFCFFFVAAVVLWLSAYVNFSSQGRKPEDIPPGVFSKLGVLCGLAVLVKGPLGIVLPVLVISAISGSLSGWKGIRSLIRPGWLWAFVISAPWYFAALWLGGSGFVGRQLVFENISRFFGSQGIVSKPPWFYVEHFFTQAAPWSLVLVLSSLWLVTKGKDPREIHSCWRFKFALRATSVWMLVIIVFLSFSAGKRRAYLLPMLPALAIHIAAVSSIYWGRIQAFDWEGRRDRVVWKSGLILWSISVSLAVLWCLATCAGVFSGASWNSEIGLTLDALSEVCARAPLKLALFFVAFSLGSLSLWLVGFKTKQPNIILFALFLYLGFVYTVGVSSALAVKGVTHTYQNFATAVHSHVPKNAELSFIKKRRDESFDGFFFYLPRTIPLREPHTAPLAPGYYLARRSWIQAQTEKWRQSVKTHLVGGRLTDTELERLELFEISPRS